MILHKLKQAFLWRKTILKAIKALVIANCRIHFRPFKKIAPSLGHPKKKEIQVLTQAQLKTAKEIGLVIRRVAPFVRCKCLAQAMAAQKLLSEHHIPSQLYLGVLKNEQSLKAHAWLKTGDVFITGGKGHEPFRQVICFNKGAFE